MIVGIDPSNTFTGLGALLHQLGDPVPKIAPVLRWWTARSMPGFERVDEGVDFVVTEFQLLRDSYWNALDHHGIEDETMRTIHVRIEEPPETVHSDVNHGHQAALGWKLGYLVGGIARGIRQPLVRVERISSSAWRAKMLQLSTIWGVPAREPGKTGPMTALSGDAAKGFTQSMNVERRQGGGFFVAWVGCGHKTVVEGGLEQLKAFPHRRCPECHLTPLTERPSDPNWRREAWKYLACELMKAHWPTWYEATARETRDRARDKDKPDHQLAGLADACEAAWIAASFVGEGL